MQRRLSRSSGAPATPIRVAVDTGGTFTDCVWLDAGKLRTLKVFSNRQDPSAAIEEAVRQAVGERPFLLLHGTTVGTNALLERKGARTALITTAGFEDAIEIGRQARPKLYDFFADRPTPLVPSELRLPAKERIASDGSIVEPLTGQELQSIAVRVAAARPQAVAICLLFSFANPDHERRIGDVLRPLGIPLSVSHQIVPEFREYERTSTTVINAYLQPLMQRYLSGIQQRLSSGTKIFVMQSSGGIAALTAVVREPVRTVLSGPAGGVVGTRAMALASGFERVIGFDMGGTSTDVALIFGELRTSNEGEIIGLPVRVPMLDIHTVGAGGGSIARLDAAGALRVGPESAGADPGPICYGRGTQPTVTDANTLLGRLRADGFLGGAFQLHVERTRSLVTEWLRERSLPWTPEEFASGVLRVVNANMEKAVRAVSLDRGYDVRDFTLVAFGGAGALHACELAQSLHIPRVLVPRIPGALSAYGILASDVVKEFSRTVMLHSADAAKLSSAAAQLRAAAQRAFLGEGWDVRRIRYRRSLDLRYRGQGYELNVPYDGRLTKSVAAFHEEHQRRYGYASVERDVEIVNVRLRSVLPIDKLPTADASATAQRTVKQKTIAPVYFNGRAHPARILAREDLSRAPLRGPAIITEYSATTVVPPGAVARLDRAENIVITFSR